MSEEQQRGPRPGLTRQLPVIQCGHDGLARPRGSDQQIAVPAVDRPLAAQLLQHGPLEIVRSDFQAGQSRAHTVGSSSTGGPHQLRVQAVAVPVRVVVLEGRIIPVGVECGRELLHQGRGRGLRDADIPLQSVQQGIAAEIGAAHVPGVEARSAVEQPCLRVQPGGPGVVADLHLRPVLPHQLIQGPSIRRTDVRGGQHPQRHPAPSQVLKPVAQQTRPAALDEGAQQIHPIGAQHLRAKLRVQRGIRRGVGEQGDVGQRSRGTTQRLRILLEDLGQQLRLGRQLGAPGVIGNDSQKSIGEFAALVRRQLLQSIADLTSQVTSQDVGQISGIDALADRYQVGRGRESGVEIPIDQPLIQTHGQVHTSQRAGGGRRRLGHGPRFPRR